MSTRESIFSKRQYSLEQKVLSIGDVYEIKDREGNLLCTVKRSKVQSGAENVGSLVGGLLGANTRGGANLLKRAAPTNLSFETPDGKKILEIKKGKGWKNIPFEINDDLGKLLGSILMKQPFIGNPYYVLKDSQGQEVATAKGKFMRYDFKVTTTRGQEVAKIHKKWASELKSKDAYGVDITDQTFDATLVLSLVLAVDVVEH